MSKKIYMGLFSFVIGIVFVMSIGYCYLEGVHLSVFMSDMELVMESAVPKKDGIREIYGAINRIISPYEIAIDGGAIVKDETGFLQRIDISPYDIKEAENKIIELRDICNENDVQFAYISYPSKVNSFNVKQFYGIDTNEEEMRTDFLNTLEENQINVLNIRKLLEEKGYTIKEMFYKTDHHWTTKAGLFAAREMARYFKDYFSYNCDLNLLNENLFSYKKYENCWLGETGRKCSKTWVGSLDDFTVIKPIYDTSFRYIVPSKGADNTGDFSMLLDEKIYDMEYNLYNTSMHYSYMPGSGLVTIVHNNNLKGLKVLLIRDSFSIVVVPFLSLVCQDIVMWDMRGNENSVYDYIRENEFDIVLVAYTDFWRSDMYNFY